MLIVHCDTVAQRLATMTLTALTKNATLTSINVDWIPTALIGPTAARIHLVLMGREIVIITRIVKEHFSVAMIIVQVDQQEWIVVNRRYTKVKHIACFEQYFFNIVIF